ncbi:hypothetical protein AN216_07595, partial [Streptomyces oceani]
MAGDGDATGAVSPAPEPEPGRAPLETARRWLQRELTARHERVRDRPAVATAGGAAGPGPAADSTAGPAWPTPRVVPLGAADVLGTGRPDPYAAARPGATVH